MHDKQVGTCFLPVSSISAEYLIQYNQLKWKQMLLKSSTCIHIKQFCQVKMQSYCTSGQGKKSLKEGQLNHVSILIYGNLEQSFLHSGLI